MVKIKVLIVDDHPMMREALQTALGEEDDMQVVGEASNGADALRAFDDLTPDVVVMDLLMPGMGGLEAIAALYAANPQVRVLVSTSLEDEQKIVAAIQAGALGYFPKTAPRAFLLDAIRQVANGIPYLPAEIAQKLFKGIRELKSAPDGQTEELLTVRQEQILALLGEGRSDKEIGQALHLEESTVRSHVHHILQRLGLENRTQAVLYANRKVTGG